MDQQLHDASSSFEHAFTVAQQRHKETVSELHRLRGELRARDDVVRRLRASLGARFDAALEFRLMTDQLKKIQELVRPMCAIKNKVVGVTAMSSNSAFIAGNAVLVEKGVNCVAKLPLEYRVDILSCLDRFSLDTTEFTCPQLRAAVATLDGQNLRDLSRVEVIGVAWDEEEEEFCRGCGDRRPDGLGNYGLGDAEQRHQSAQKIITIVVDYSSDPKALKNGASSAAGKLTWQFTDTQKAASVFVGLLRNACLGQLSLSLWPSQCFIQELSVADVYVEVGSLTLDRFWQEVENLPVACEALMPFNRLETLAINDAPLGLLSDHFLLTATHRRVTSIALMSDLFGMGDGDDFLSGLAVRDSAGIAPEYFCPELCDGIMAFLFRDDVDVTVKVKLHFPGARVPLDFCQRLMEGALSTGSLYSIDALFAPIDDVNENLVRFEKYQSLDEAAHGACMTYRVPVPDATDVFVELNIATMEHSDGFAGPRIMWKVIRFRRFQESEQD